MTPVDPPDEPTTLQRPDDAPDTLVSSDRREGQVVAGTIEQEDPTTAKGGFYAFGEVIGRGGGGEVVLAHDLRVGRDVAVKRLKDHQSSESAVARFLREARIQARLEHPAIVPVYELGRDPSGRPFFTMRRLAGTTLGAILATRTPQRLLRVLADVCFAIEYAHSRGIVHRDLKPANIMLGDFGEVFILDWGVARVVAEAATPGLVTGDIESLEGGATLLGTPGYMAPEQIHTPDQVDRPADIYALGSILFEIITGEPLHPRGPDAMASTLTGLVVTSPAARRPDRGVPPELDALCIAALAMAPAARPTARELAHGLQAYLDGDRDVARRRALSGAELLAAQHALAAGDRAEAMRAAGRSLALDPETSGAAELITALMLEPPAAPPPNLRATLHLADIEHVRRHARTAIVAYATIASFLPVAMWNGVRKWPVVLGVFFAALMMAFAAWRIRRRPDRGLGEMLIYAAGNVVLLALLSRMAGPFTFVPALTCVVTMSCMAYPAFVLRPAVLIAIMVVGFLIPIGLELQGYLDLTWEIRDGVLISHAGALDVAGTSTAILLVVASVATFVIAGIHAAALAGTSRRQQQQLVSQAWHLRQLLPAKG
jgi:hypothetical protein